MKTDKATREEVRRLIAEYIKNNPHKTLKEVSSRLQCSVSTLSATMREHGIVRNRHIDVDAVTALTGE
jgi:predicted transcriptional regulator